MSDVNLNFSVTHDEVQQFMRALKTMQAKDVLVGFPADETPREDEDGNPTPITNAAIAYVQDKGSPEQNIPPRPFMVPGIETERQPITDGMEKVGIAALDGDAMRVEQGLHSVGQTAKQGIQQKIVDGPFEPLAESTLRGRVRHGGSIGAAAEQELDRRAAGEDPGVDLSRPLNFTGQLHDSVQYVIRERTNS